VRSDLLRGGYDEADCVLYRSGEVTDAAQQNLAQNTSWLSRLGGSDEAVRAHLASARKGASFLLVYAPGDIEAGGAMNVIRRVAFVFVHGYHRMAIEEMQ
jgi:hypothetical protein